MSLTNRDVFAITLKRSKWKTYLGLGVVNNGPSSYRISDWGEVEEENHQGEDVHML